MAPQPAVEEDQRLQAPLLPHRHDKEKDEAADDSSSTASAGDAVLVTLPEDQRQQQSLGQTVRGTHWLLTTAIMLSDMFGLG